jgi:6-phosphofructokinase 1
MNAAIRSIVLAAHHYKLEILGFYSGYSGLIDDNSTKLIPASINRIIHRGGTFLKVPAVLLCAH